MVTVTLFLVLSGDLGYWRVLVGSMRRLYEIVEVIQGIMVLCGCFGEDEYGELLGGVRDL